MVVASGWYRGPRGPLTITVGPPGCCGPAEGVGLRTTGPFCCVGPLARTAPPVGCGGPLTLTAPPVGCCGFTTGLGNLLLLQQKTPRLQVMPIILAWGSGTSHWFSGAHPHVRGSTVFSRACTFWRSRPCLLPATSATLRRSRGGRLGAWPRPCDTRARVRSMAGSMARRSTGSSGEKRNSSNRFVSWHGTDCEQ